jgi:uncharacterized Zn finger protein
MFMLRARRVQHAIAEEEDAVAITELPVVEEPSEPLAVDPDRFWHGPGELSDFRTTVAAPAIDAAPIKRLGAPKFWQGKQDFVLLLTRAYQAISQAVIASK